MSGLAFFILQRVIIKTHDKDFVLKKVIGKDIKGKLSLFLYAVGLLFSFIYTWIAITLYIIVALLWIIPDKCIEPSD
jgi:uncharacterized membrane protein